MNASRLTTKTKTTDNFPAPPKVINRALERFQSLRVMARHPQVAEKLWFGVLTEPERQIIGGDFATAFDQPGGPIGWWTRLRGVSPLQAVLDITLATDNLSEADYRLLANKLNIPLATRSISSVPAMDLKQLNAAIVSTPLVVTESPRAVFWHGVELGVDWDKRRTSWDFVFSLCKNAKRGRSLKTDEIRESAEPQYLSKQKHRLSKVNDEAIAFTNQIMCDGRGTVRLNLNPKQIRIFLRQADSMLVEMR